MTERSCICIGDASTEDKLIETYVPAVSSDIFPIFGEEAREVIGQSSNDWNQSMFKNLEHEPSNTDVEVTSPFPLVHRLSTAWDRKEDSDDLISLLKAQIVQYGIFRDEEHQRRYKYRKNIEEERR